MSDVKRPRTEFQGFEVYKEEELFQYILTSHEYDRITIRYVTHNNMHDIYLEIIQFYILNNDKLFERFLTALLTADQQTINYTINYIKYYTGNNINDFINQGQDIEDFTIDILSDLSKVFLASPAELINYYESNNIGSRNQISFEQFKAEIELNSIFKQYYNSKTDQELIETLTRFEELLVVEKENKLYIPPNDGSITPKLNRRGEILTRGPDYDPNTPRFIYVNQDTIKVIKLGRTSENIWTYEF